MALAHRLIDRLRGVLDREAQPSKGRLLAALDDIEKALDAMMFLPVEPSLTIPQFCAAEEISESSYYKLKALGLTPEEMSPPGLPGLVRITAAARKAWQERIATLDDTAGATLRAARSQHAAASEKHVSKQKKKRR